MKRIIQTTQKLYKGLTVNKEFILDLNDKQTELIDAVAIQCDWQTGDILVYLVDEDNKKLLNQLFKGDLEKLKETLIEEIFMSNFDI